ncbi:flagellar hook-basal body complex protein FliE [Flexibacterium corallicola]|uniref:flagellar hook-basal body complex protein FliE n=1 Tax=Flexibacterium corallicola TaxID=3037259 RepID=UPI00286F9754|nr:flagellar hook-basal body complex protein FliE [Pseudovibrio sp. M1P-2-3]
MVDPVSGLGAVSSARGVDSLGGVNRTRQYVVGGGAEVAAPTESFADTMAAALENTAGDLKNAEVSSIGGVKGEVSAQNVVEAVMKAELSLKSALAVRDKVVDAYMEFSRMSI